MSYAGSRWAEYRTAVADYQAARARMVALRPWYVRPIVLVTAVVGLGVGALWAYDELVVDRPERSAATSGASLVQDDTGG